LFLFNYPDAHETPATPAKNCLFLRSPGVVAYEIQNLPPAVETAEPGIGMLWPANHKMLDVSILGVTDPDCDLVNIVITNISQDEPTNGHGDGNTCPDGRGIGTSTAQLRAERDGGRNGRVYIIYFIATDSRGASTIGSVRVRVPKNPGNEVIEDGLKVDSTRCPD
jgi:hypothetical protein